MTAGFACTKFAACAVRPTRAALPTPRILAIALVLLVTSTAALGGERTFTLDNGLTAILRPVETGELVALAVLYEIGELDDPPGRSGLAHFVEHLYVTAAAGNTPSRTAESYFARYAGQANAQTGADYTLIAAVFAKSELPAEIDDAAARMIELQVNEADLARERRRMEIELRNMYGGIPTLAAMNLARCDTDPYRPGARKGGVVEQIAAITLAEIRDVLRRLYKPRHATLVVAGSFDPAETERRIRARFSAIAPGEASVPRPALPAATLGGSRQIALPPPGPAGLPGSGHGVATLAFRVPDPDSESFAPYLFLVARLFQQSMPIFRQPGRTVMPVTFAPLDDPRVVFVSEDVAADQTNEEIMHVLRERIERATTIPPDEKPNRWMLMSMFGSLFGLIETPETMIAMNPYSTAFSLGRLHQLGIDPKTLRPRIDAVTDDDLRRCAEAVFAAERGAGVVVRPE